MNVNLSFNPQALLNGLKRFAPQLVGLALVAAFGYTGWVVNEAFNVKPAETENTVTTIKFNKEAIELLGDR